MDCILDEPTGEFSAENALSCSVNDIAATVKSEKCQTRQQGNANCSDIVMEDVKSVTHIPELNNLEKKSCKEEDLGLPMANIVESDKLLNCRGGNKDNLADENPSRSHTMDESDDSDFVLQDVKVCDICGDAGREDLLAICCRCSDGAEHTYCMRKMLDKVPEGDWMCEECIYEEEMKNQTQHKVVNVERTGPRKVSGGILNSCLKSDTRSGNGLELASKDHSTVKILGKRLKEDAEVFSVSKRQALESVIGSPKTSASSIVASLSRENSLRNLDRRKEKLAHQSSSGAAVGSDDTESTRALVTSLKSSTHGGSFLKSNSFSSLTAKPKVNVVDEAVPLKHKSVREPPPLDMKEGIGKSYGRSMSFRDTSSGRYRNSESKVKMLSPELSHNQMLSPELSHNQDNKGFKHIKEQSVLERKSSFKSEKPGISSPRVSSSNSTKNEKKLFCRDETALSSESNNNRSRAVQFDSKASSLSKILSLTSMRASNNHVAGGDCKRQSITANGFSGSEQKTSIIEEPFLSGNAGRSSCGDINEHLIDKQSQSKDSVSIDETIQENGNHSKLHTGNGGKNEICQKCKEVGHLAQCCPVDGLPDVATSKSLREVTNGSNDLKAAIEAAMRRKPGICRKPRVADLSNGSSHASKNVDMVSQDHFVGPFSKKDVYSGLVKDVVTAVRSSPNSCRHASLDNVEPSTSKTGDRGLVVPYDGKTSITDLPFQPPSPISVLWRTSAIPEHEFMWQGNFEVSKKDKVECCDGVQAHLSSCASPRVHSVVNKFPQKVLLNEVPRLSTWPLQFQEYGVKEDDVALYFFAKDDDSYERSYKLLLEIMIKKDLALKGIIDGVEILIFPSTQLPQQSQRWNMLHFLWGVFRGKKTSQLYQVCSIPEQNILQQDNHPATLSLPENIYSLEHVEKNLASNASVIAEMTASKDGFNFSGVPSVVQVKEVDRVHVGTLGSILGSNTLNALLSNSMKEGGADFKCNSEVAEAQAPVQDFPRHGSSECADHIVNSETIIGDVSNMEAPLVRVSVTTEQIKNDSSSTQLNDLNFKHPHGDEKIISEATSTTSGQAIQIDEDVIVLGPHKIQKIGSDVSNDQSSSSNDDFSVPIHGVSSGPSIISGEAFVDKTTSSKWGKSERFFFPVEPVGATDKSIPGKTHPLENQILIESPNLDLALGGEAGLSTPGITSFLVDKKVIEDDPKEKQSKEGEEDISCSLSLSLSFPFSDKEQDLTSMLKVGQLTEKPQVNPPFLLFGGIREK